MNGNGSGNEPPDGGGGSVRPKHEKHPSILVFVILTVSKLCSYLKKKGTNYLLNKIVSLQWNKTWDKNHREHYYYNWPIYFP